MTEDPSFWGRNYSFSWQNGYVSLRREKLNRRNSWKLCIIQLKVLKHKFLAVKLEAKYRDLVFNWSRLREDYLGILPSDPYHPHPLPLFIGASHRLYWTHKADQRIDSATLMLLVWYVDENQQHIKKAFSTKRSNGHDWFFVLAKTNQSQFPCNPNNSGS